MKGQIVPSVYGINTSRLRFVFKHVVMVLGFGMGCDEEAKT